VHIPRLCYLLRHARDRHLCAIEYPARQWSVGIQLREIAVPQSMTTPPLMMLLRGRTIWLDVI